MPANNLSGVNLDEEAAKMVQFQQAYQACAQIIQASNTMFNSLITAITAADHENLDHHVPADAVTQMNTLQADLAKTQKRARPRAKLAQRRRRSGRHGAGQQMNVQISASQQYVTNGNYGDSRICSSKSRR